MAPGMLECARMLVREGGVARLYRGCGFTLLRAGPVAGVLLPLFDIMLAALDSCTHGDTARSMEYAAQPALRPVLQTP